MNLQVNPYTLNSLNLKHRNLKHQTPKPHCPMWGFELSASSSRLQCVVTVTIAVTISDDAMQYWGSSSGVWSVLASRLEFAGCRLEQNVRADPETVKAGLGTGDGRVPQIVLTFAAGRADGWFHVKVSSRIERMSIWDFPQIRVPLFWGPYNKDPTI